MHAERCRGELQTDDPPTDRNRLGAMMIDENNHYKPYAYQKPNKYNHISLII